MSPLLLLIPIGVVAYLAAAKDTKKKSPPVSAVSEEEAKILQQIQTEMPTQFVPDWHLGAASWLRQVLGVPPEDASITSLIGMAAALQKASAEEYAQTVSAMIAARRTSHVPMLWYSQFPYGRGDAAVPYYVCDSGLLENPSEGSCALRVPVPSTGEIIEVVA